MGDAGSRGAQRCQCAFKILAQQLVKSMRRAVPVQHFPRSIVEHRLYAFDLSPRNVLKLGAGGKELPQQAVRVLVRAPLPRTLGMGKVDRHLGLFGKQPMFSHLLPLVIRERAAKLGGQGPDLPREGPSHGRGILGRERHQQRKSGGPFHERPKRRRVRMADKQVALPMAGHGASGDLGWPFVDADDVLDGARREADLAGPPKAMASPEVPGEGTLEGVWG